jgi:rod shape determining protein RodA
MGRVTWRNFDFWLFGSVLILSIFGIVMIRSAIAGNETLTGLDSTQAIFVAIGMGVIIAAAAFDYHYFQTLTRVMYVSNVGFLVVLLAIGDVAFGSNRWINIGPVNIQPSELAKIIMILVLADYFSRTQNSPKDFRWVFRSLALTGGVVVWIILQPDLSTSIVIIVIWFALIWLAGLPPRFLAIFAVLGTLTAVLAFPFLEEYQQGRIINFLFPDPNARYGNTYNVDQALVTIGSGGLFGQGYGHSPQVQLRFLKVRHTDFIFSAMAAEFGFIGTVVVIALMVFMLMRCLRAVRLARDMYGSLIAFGFSILILFQMVVNIGVNLNLVPVTGLTLPFISYGGSSLLSLALGIGLVESVALRSRTGEANI